MGATKCWADGDDIRYNLCRLYSSVDINKKIILSYVDFPIVPQFIKAAMTSKVLDKCP